MATLSHVSFVSGLGHSCSHPTFAKRPSYTAASGAKWISSPPFFAGAGDGGGTAPDAFIVFGGNAVSAITPLWTDRRQNFSKSWPAACGCAFQWSRSAS